jgi:tRNA (guanine37-N1)-methyltransferase
MKFTVLSLFPEILEGFFESSIMAKAVERGEIAYELINIRDFAYDRHKTCDDAPYGGGAGMVMKAEPVALAMDSVKASQKRTVYMSPSGELFNQKFAQELSSEKEIVILCGRYEGVDQRIIEAYIDNEISVGDYVLSSGETASLVVIDAVYRLIEGVINAESLSEESFTRGLLEYPHYTRPEVFRGMKVPDVLMSGHHAKIERWRLLKSLEKTLKVRPDLLAAADKTDDVKEILEEIDSRETMEDRNGLD